MGLKIGSIDFGEGGEIMTCYVNPRKLFLILVCLQSSAFFARAFDMELEISSDAPANSDEVTLKFMRDNEVLYTSDKEEQDDLTTSRDTLKVFDKGTYCYGSELGCSYLIYSSTCWKSCSCKPNNLDKPLEACTLNFAVEPCKGSPGEGRIACEDGFSPQ